MLMQTCTRNDSSSKPVPLTEAETEYIVTVVKHVFPKHVVLQFNLNNTLADQLLEQVTFFPDVLYRVPIVVVVVGFSQS
jgi:hypothetical protein